MAWLRGKLLPGHGGFFLNWQTHSSFEYCVLIHQLPLQTTLQPHPGDVKCSLRIGLQFNTQVVQCTAPCLTQIAANACSCILLSRAMR